MRNNWMLTTMAETCRGHESSQYFGLKNVSWMVGQPGELTMTSASSAEDDDRAEDRDEHGAAAVGLTAAEEVGPRPRCTEAGWSSRALVRPALRSSWTGRAPSAT